MFLDHFRAAHPPDRAVEALQPNPRTRHATRPSLLKTSPGVALREVSLPVAAEASEQSAQSVLQRVPWLGESMAVTVTHGARSKASAVPVTASIREAMLALDRDGLEIVFVIGDDDRLAGLLT